MVKKVLFIITKSEVGGAQKWVKEQIDILNENKYESYICTNKVDWLTKNSNYKKHLIDKRIEKRTSLTFLFSLIKFIKENDITILVGNSANGGIYSRLAAFITGKKNIYVSHGWSSIYNGGILTFFFNAVERTLSNLNSKVLCVSENDFRIALQEIRISPHKLITIPNKINAIKLANQQYNNINKKKNIIKILFLGRLASPKNPIPLIKAIKNKAEYSLDIIGTGPQKSDIAIFLKKENIKNVKLKGEIKNFTKFNDYDIFCLISKSEGLPLSAIEALSCGLPILISNVGGCPELIDKNGYLTDNSPEDILKGITSIKQNCQEFAENSLTLFRKKFDLKENYQEYIELYENI
jgi:glycosyltransferase involved in cell wall biosynthesis